MNEIIDLKEQKQIMLQIMDHIHLFCIENNINYFLIGGSLLGAIRHKGYIPWDDDLDIGMLREDYQKFIERFNDPTGKYVLKHIDIDPDCYLPMAKVIDIDTILDENVRGVKPIGVYVDVFPFDYCGNTIGESVVFAKKSERLRKCLSIKNISYSKNRNVIKNILIAVLKFLLLPIRRRSLIHRLEESLKKNSEHKSAYVGELVLFPYGEKELYKLDWVNSTCLADFEGRKYYIPEKYDEFLTKTFNNYMQMPPKDKQITHHNQIVYRKQ